MNLSDKELDRLSREAAGQYEVEEDNLSWEKLRQQLDEEMGNAPPPAQTVTRLRRPLIYFSLLLLIAGISWLLLKPVSSNTVALRAPESPNKISGLNRQADSEKTIKTEGASPEAVLNRDPQENSSSKNSRIKSETTASNQKLVEKPGPDSRDQIKSEKGSNPTLIPLPVETSVRNKMQKQESGRSIIKPYSIKKNGNSLARKNAHATKTQNGEEKNISSSDKVRMTKPGHLPSEKGLAETSPNKSAGRRASVYPHQSAGNSSQSGDGYENELAREIKPAIIPFPESVTGNQIIRIDDASLRSVTALAHIELAAINSVKKIQRYLNLSKPLHIGVLIAPELTKVETTLPNNLSATIGLTLGYQFSRNWSVNTGILYTKKNYVAKGYDFHGTTIWPIDHAVGNCNMLEIPLSIRYDFGRIKKASFFASGGLASYLMKKESYTYYYKDGQPPQDWAQNTNKNYWFSVASLSVGIEENISKNLSIQAEPFVKLPLAGIGYGNLQLTSYGVNFTIRYSPVLKTARH